MNFLSHYHFYKKGDPYYNVGLVLPDLVRNFSRTHLKPLPEYKNNLHQSLGDGSKSHIEADRIFHQSDFFKACEQHISNVLDQEAKWPRKWFLNHLLLEIGLDRVLMDRHSELCGDFYNQLESIDIQNITSFLKASGTDHYDSFATGFERFVSFRFIFDYAHNEKIFLALSRVYQRTGIEYDWTSADKTQLLQQIPGILDFIDKHTDLLQQELK